MTDNNVDKFSSQPDMNNDWIAIGRNSEVENNMWLAPITWKSIQQHAYWKHSQSRDRLPGIQTSSCQQWGFFNLKRQVLSRPYSQVTVNCVIVETARENWKLCGASDMHKKQKFQPIWSCITFLLESVSMLCLHQKAGTGGDLMCLGRSASLLYPLPEQTLSSRLQQVTVEVDCVKK